MAKDFNITVDDKEVKAALKRLENRLGNMQPIYNDISVLMIEDIQTHFKKEKGETSSWAPLKPKTLERKLSKGISPRKLVGLNRKLEQSFIKSANKKAAITSNPVDYGIFHNLGTKHLPKREFMFLTKKSIKDILTVISDEIEKLWRK